MGRSPKIENMRKERQDFQSYLDEIDKSLETKVQLFKKEIDEEVIQFNSANKYDDSKLILRGNKKDFLHQKEWSLDNIKNIVDVIAGSIFNKKHKDIPGVETAKDEDSSASIMEMQNLQLYIASKAFDVIAGVIEQFGTKTSIKQDTKKSTAPIAPGITMFITVDAAQKDAKGFFDKETIFQFVFVFEVRFSVKQSQLEAKMNDVQMYSDLLAVKRNKIRELNKKYADGKCDDDEFETRYKNLEESMELISKKLHAINAVEAAKANMLQAKNAMLSIQ